MDMQGATLSAPELQLPAVPKLSELAREFWQALETTDDEDTTPPTPTVFRSTADSRHQVSAAGKPW